MFLSGFHELNISSCDIPTQPWHDLVIIYILPNDGLREKILIIADSR